MSYGYMTQLRTSLTNQQPNASPWVVSYAYDDLERKGYLQLRPLPSTL